MPSKNTSKFSGMIPKNLPQEEAPPPAEELDSPPGSKTRVRRPAKSAKYNNSDFRQTNFYLHVDTYADAHAKLRKERSGRDMSDLINELLAKWLKE